MVVQALRVDATHLDKVARLFDAYRGFYGQPSNLTQSRDFIAERIARDESAIFLAEDTAGHALGFVQLYPTFSSIDAHRTWLLSDLFTSPQARGRGGRDVADEHRSRICGVERCQGHGAGNGHRQSWCTAFV